MKSLVCVSTHLSCNSIENPTVDNDCFSKRAFCKLEVTNSKNTCVSRNCNEYSGSTPTSYSICQEYDYSCINTRSNNGCITM